MGAITMSSTALLTIVASELSRGSAVYLFDLLTRDSKLLSHPEIDDPRRERDQPFRNAHGKPCDYPLAAGAIGEPV
jgi:hypothetical protein